MGLIENMLIKLLKSQNLVAIPGNFDFFEAATSLGRGNIPAPKELMESIGTQIARGFYNAMFFTDNSRDWIIPYWAYQQFKFTGEDAIPKGHTLIIFNTNYRTWSTIGGIGGVAESIVDPKGWVVPEIEQYSIAYGIYDMNKNQILDPVKDGFIKQKLIENYLPIIDTRWNVEKSIITQIVFGAVVNKNEIGTINFGGNIQENHKFLVSIRPFNTEGIALIKEILFDSSSNIIYVNGKAVIKISASPNQVFVGNYRLGDSMHLKNAKLANTIKCNVGLANITMVFDDPHVKLEFLMRGELSQGSTLGIEKEKWKNIIAKAPKINVGNVEIERLFYVSIANLLLHKDPGSITPGPSEYHQFWIRDTAYMANALDRLGYTTEARDILNEVIRRQRKNGMYHSQETEWDSAGQGIWVLAEHYWLNRDTKWLENTYESIRKATDWIIANRMLDHSEYASGEDTRLIKGLLPPGFSAEHLGQSDFYYWDNIWALAGLREAFLLGNELGHKASEIYFREYEAYAKDLLESIETVGEKLGFIPVGPFRKDDSAIIANMAAIHPTQIFETDYPLIKSTAEHILKKYTIDYGFTHEVAWKCFGTYLTMHLAQYFVYANRSKEVSQIIKWLVEHTVSPMGWSEGISPQTMSGGMGDCPHAWASADWILLLKNLFVIDYPNEKLELLSGMPEEFLIDGVRLSSIKTRYGTIGIKAQIKHNILNVSLQGNLSINKITIKAPRQIKDIKEKAVLLQINNKEIEVSTDKQNYQIYLE